MKIKKFNENIENEPWTKEKLNKLNDLKSKVWVMEEDLKKLLYEYLKLNPKLLEIEDEFYIDFIRYNWLPLDSDVTLEIKYSDDDGDEFYVSLNSKRFDDFLEFAKNPDLYKNARKYNL